MNRDDALSSEPFSYVETKNSLVQISFRGKVVTTLAGTEASRFLNKADSPDARSAQLAMAKATGHFKPVNERLTKQNGN